MKGVEMVIYSELEFTPLSLSFFFSLSFSLSLSLLSLSISLSLSLSFYLSPLSLSLSPSPSLIFFPPCILFNHFGVSSPFSFNSHARSLAASFFLSFYPSLRLLRHLFLSYHTFNPHLISIAPYFLASNYFHVAFVLLPPTTFT